LKFTGVWVHVEGYNTPAFDSSGFITGPDASKTLTTDLKAFLDAAKLKNVMVIFTLWNGAVQSNQNVNNLFWDKSKLTSYLTKALTVSTFDKSEMVSSEYF
jgi:mannan endo-1,4-beta-mannosidase